jgi:hypothetical protein
VNIAYLIYEAERPKTVAERRADAVRSGELAKAVSRVLRRRRDFGPAQPVRPALALVRDSEPSAASAASAPTAPSAAPVPCACGARTAS